MKILVCDDIPEIAQGWVDEITDTIAEAEVSRIEHAKEEILKLNEREQRIDDGKAPSDEKTIFDDLDVLVIDYDLVMFDELKGRTTGEGIARLVRTFSTCGAIVVMNQYRGAQFDLGMRGHFESNADVNVDADLIGFSALWQSTAPTENTFNPTTWVPLPKLLDGVSAVIATLTEAGEDALIMNSIGLEKRHIEMLSDTAFGLIGPNAEKVEDLESLTVKNYLLSARGVKQGEQLLQYSPETSLRFVAFRIRKWLERCVLRQMDILIDGPHLVERMPFLMIGWENGQAVADTWTEAAHDPAEKLMKDFVDKYRMATTSTAIGRDVFDWEGLQNDPEIEELQDKALEIDGNRFALAEDTSRFIVPNSDKLFRADFHNFGDRRTFEGLEDIDYGPRRRLTFGE